MNETDADAAQSHSGVLWGAACSLTFWVCLFSAAALYGGAALSSKLCSHGALRAEFESNQWQLVALQQRVDRLRKVIDAHQRDPAFVREQAQADFELSPPDEQRIPVEPHLTLNIGPGRTLAPARRAALPFYASAARAIAESCELSNGLLAAAAALVIGAFTLLPVRRTNP